MSNKNKIGVIAGVIALMLSLWLFFGKQERPSSDHVPIKTLNTGPVPETYLK